MKSIILFITFITFLSSNYAQEWQRDVLFEMRQKYSSPKKFNKYCMYKYTLCKLNPPPPPPSSTKHIVLKKYFNIPKDVRLNMYPFNEYDSITIHLYSENRTILLDKLNKSILSDIVFNYTIDDRGGTVYHLTEDTMAMIKFYNTHYGLNRFVSLYYGGEVKTDFTEFELSQFDINKEKFELFLKKTK